MIMKILKKLLNSNYIEKDAEKAIKIRKSIEENRIKNKIIRKLQIRKYDKILYKNNSSIPLQASIGEGLCLPHGLSGIFVSVGATIGKNCTIFHQVTIGSNTLKDSKGLGAPTLGDNVYIGTGAKIIGNVKIGNNVRIGANAIITTDVPDNSTVVMERPRIIIHKEKRDNSFIKYNTYENR